MFVPESTTKMKSQLKQNLFLRCLISFVSVVAGIAMSAAPALGMDYVLGAFDSPARPWGDGMFVLAAAYRAIFAIMGGYVTAKFAPASPKGHTLVLGALGTLAGIGGIAAYFSSEKDMGPLWYPFAVCAIALPCAWIGWRLVGGGKPAK